MANITKKPAILRLIPTIKKNTEEINKKVANKKADNTPLEAGKHYGVKGTTGELEEIQIPKATSLADQFGSLSGTEKDLIKHALGMTVPDHTITRGAPEVLDHYVQVVRNGGKVKYNFHSAGHTTKDIVTEDTLVWGSYKDGAWARFGAAYNFYHASSGEWSYMVGSSGTDVFSNHQAGATHSPFTYDGINIPKGTPYTLAIGSLSKVLPSVSFFSMIATLKGIDHVATIDNTYWLYADGKWYDAETGGTEVTPAFTLPATLDTNHSLTIQYS